MKEFGYRAEKPFSIAECYKALENDGLILIPYKCLWNPNIQVGLVIFFVCNLCYITAPTMDAYRNSFQFNGCLLCKQAGESNNHIFLVTFRNHQRFSFLLLFSKGYELR